LISEITNILLEFREQLRYEIKTKNNELKKEHYKQVQIPQF